MNSGANPNTVQISLLRVAEVPMRGSVNQRTPLPLRSVTERGKGLGDGGRLCDNAARMKAGDGSRVQRSDALENTRMHTANIPHPCGSPNPDPLIPAYTNICSTKTAKSAILRQHWERGFSIRTRIGQVTTKTRS
jgi:hypothetical protein